MAYNYGNYQSSPYYPTAVSGSWSPNNYQATVPMQPVQQPQPQSQPQTNQGFVWVQGEAGAKAYPVAAGNSVLLMDSENPVLYMKSTDASGRPLPIETYDLVKREPVSTQPVIPKPQQPQVDLSEYVKMSDLEAKVQELVNKALEQ